MEKESRSGQPYHISPLDRRSGSNPENTVTEAREQVATFRVRISSGTMVEASPPKRKDTTSRYPVWVKTPTANSSSTRPATRANTVVTSTSKKQAIKNQRLFTNQGTNPKNKYHTSRIRGSSLAITVSSLP